MLGEGGGRERMGSPALKAEKKNIPNTRFLMQNGSLRAGTLAPLEERDGNLGQVLSRVQESVAVQKHWNVAAA